MKWSNGRGKEGSIQGYLLELEDGNEVELHFSDVDGVISYIGVVSEEKKDVYFPNF